ncbi:MAG: hypothetical protein AABM30_11255 [Actinomycetota bacterium]
MKIRVHEAGDLNSLVAFLKERDYLADEIGPNTIEVSRVSSVRHDFIRLELDLLIEAWRAAHPEGRAELIE